MARNLQVLANSVTAVRYAATMGMIFAIVLSILFASALLTGALFPTITPGESWFFTLWKPAELAKWLVWGFVAGFSERLVPDILDRFATRADEDTKALAPPPSPPPPSVAGAGPGAPAGGAPAGDAAGGMPPQLKFTRCDPAFLPEADASTFTITGEGFNAATTVEVGGVSKAPADVTLISPTELRVALTAQETGIERVSVKLRDPAGAEVMFNVPTKAVG